MESSHSGFLKYFLKAYTHGLCFAYFIFHKKKKKKLGQPVDRENHDPQDRRWVIFSLYFLTTVTSPFCKRLCWAQQKSFLIKEYFNLPLWKMKASSHNLYWLFKTLKICLPCYGKTEFKILTWKRSISISTRTNEIWWIFTCVPVSNMVWTLLQLPLREN